MTITRRDLNPIGSAPTTVASLVQPKVIKSYEDKPAAEPHTPEIVPNEVSEEPAEAAPEANEETSETTETQVEKSAAEKRAEKREALKEADKAYQRGLQMQKEASEKMGKAEQFYKLMETAKDNPMAVAQALGVDPTEFLRKYQNQIFNIKEEETPVDPQEQIKQTLEQYNKEREQERQQLQQTHSQLIRSNYINQKILPELVKDPDKYELAHRSNIEASANLIYDVMNEHFQKTGEELSVNEVAEAYEAKLEEQMVSAVTKSREIKKLAKFFNQVEKAKEEVKEEPIPTRKSKTLSNSLGSAPVPPVSTPRKTPGHDRESRIRRVVEKFGK